MQNAEKVPSFVTANLLTSHFTTCRFAVQIATKVSILLVNTAWQLRSDMQEMGSDMQNFHYMLELERLSQVNLTTQTSKCGFDGLEQCIPEIGL